MTNEHPVHVLGKRAKILLSSVFGPYAQDDEYGSRKINPMELYHNQVTRVQGVFSLRMFHRSFGLLMIQKNIDAPCTLLDFPDLDTFIDTLSNNNYDVVGLSSIIPNVDKVKKMCRLIRQYQPGAVIVVGGHISNLDGVEEILDADHIVRGDGIEWFRRYLGQDVNETVRHPAVSSATRTRILGHTLASNPADTAAIVVPSVGCPMGCNFCSTSALFGGKGNFKNFYETGNELFNVMVELERKLKTRSFFILDENFLLHRKRALGLLDEMKRKKKSWSLYIFSSARVLRSYTIKQLVELGISWVWMGLEGRKSQYAKLAGIETGALVSELQQHGIRVLGSSIIGLEEHSPENINEVLEYAVSHSVDFHQFMLYTANHGTPLHAQLKKEGTLLSQEEIRLSDSHGQFRFNYRHPSIPPGAEEEYLLEAFELDFRINGPSLFRLIRTTLAGWKRYQMNPDARIRNRYLAEVKPLRTMYAGAIWAMIKWYQKDRQLNQKLGILLQEIYKTLGWQPRLIAPLVGRYVYQAMKKEKKRLDAGWTLEPETCLEKNEAARVEETERNTAPLFGKKGVEGQSEATIFSDVSYSR